MVSRKDVNTFVQEKIDECLNGASPPEESRTVKDAPDLLTSDDFKPSRGDEPYIFKAKDESLREIHSRMLDCIEEYEAAVWVEMEKNRR